MDKDYYLNKMRKLHKKDSRQTIICIKYSSPYPRVFALGPSPTFIIFCDEA